MSSSWPCTAKSTTTSRTSCDSSASLEDRVDRRYEREAEHFFASASGGTRTLDFRELVRESAHAAADSHTGATEKRNETAGSSGGLSSSRSCSSRLPHGVRPARSNPAVPCHIVAPPAGRVGDARLAGSTSSVHPFEISRTGPDLGKRPVGHAVDLQLALYAEFQGRPPVKETLEAEEH